MNEMTHTTAESSDDNKYFLEEQELWDNLGFERKTTTLCRSACDHPARPRAVS